MKQIDFQITQRPRPEGVSHFDVNFHLTRYLVYSFDDWFNIVVRNLVLLEYQKKLVLCTVSMHGENCQEHLNVSGAVMARIQILCTTSYWVVMAIVLSLDLSTPEKRDT